jgi:hypothetical protein
VALAAAKKSLDNVKLSTLVARAGWSSLQIARHLYREYNIRSNVLVKITFGPAEVSLTAEERRSALDRGDEYHKRRMPWVPLPFPYARGHGLLLEDVVMPVVMAKTRLKNEDLCTRETIREIVPLDLVDENGYLGNLEPEDGSVS